MTAPICRCHHVTTNDADQGRAQGVPLPAGTDAHRTEFGGSLFDVQFNTGADVELSQAAQCPAVAVGDPFHQEPVAYDRAVEGQLLIFEVNTVLGRDRVTMGVTLREVESGVDEVLDLLAESVLEHLRLGVDLVPAESENIMQKGLQQAMAAYDATGMRRPMVVEANLAPCGLLDEVTLTKSSDHGRDRR